MLQTEVATPFKSKKISVNCGALSTPEFNISDHDDTKSRFSSYFPFLRFTLFFLSAAFIAYIFLRFFLILFLC